MQAMHALVAGFVWSYKMLRCLHRTPGLHCSTDGASREVAAVRNAKEHLSGFLQQAEPAGTDRCRGKVQLHGERGLRAVPQQSLASFERIMRSTSALARRGGVILRCAEGSCFVTPYRSAGRKETDNWLLSHVLVMWTLFEVGESTTLVDVIGWQPGNNNAFSTRARFRAMYRHKWLAPCMYADLFQVVKAAHAVGSGGTICSHQCWPQTLPL